MLIDSHCHLAFKAFNDNWQDAIKRARDKNIQMICVGAARASSEKSITIAESSDGVFASVGMHPTHVEDEEFDHDWYYQAADNEKVVAIGETGIDHYHLDESRRGVILAKQEDLLRQHLTIARENDLPVILHCRDGKHEQFGAAYNHLYGIIADYGYRRCVLHCYGGDWEMAKKFLHLNVLISFTGIVSFKNISPKLKEVVVKAPADMFMIETDSPYLAPEPYRGKQNEPAYVEHVARAIAEIRGVDYDEVVGITSENARRFFDIK